MINQPMGGFHGPVSDIEIQTREIQRYKKRLNEILAPHTRQEVEKIAHDSDRDFFMSSEEAKTYGLVDEVMTTRPR